MGGADYISKLDGTPVVKDSATSDQPVILEPEPKAKVGPGSPTGKRVVEKNTRVAKAFMCWPGDKSSCLRLACIRIKNFFRIFVPKPARHKSCGAEFIRHEKTAGMHLSMATSSNIVHRYFKKEWEGGCILVRVNPVHLKGTELIVQADGKVHRRDLDFDEAIFDDLAADDFKEASAMEFQLYFSGLAGV